MLTKNGRFTLLNQNSLLSVRSSVASKFEYLPVDINIHDSAVWIKDGESTFKQCGDNGTSQASLLKDTHGDEHWDLHYSHDSEFVTLFDIKVKTINFYNFLKSFGQDQDIYIKNGYRMG